MTNKGTIIYPIETKKRETDGVILLGIKMAKLGYKFILGPKRELNYQLTTYKPNILIASNASLYRESEIMFSYVRKIGGKIVVIDTEGGVIIEETYKNRHDKILSQQCRLFFAWGKQTIPLLNEGSNIPIHKIRVGGCPWFDLLRDKQKAEKFYQEEVNQIEKEYGRSFILYNSRFSANNLFNEVLEKEIAENYSNNKYYEYSKELFLKFIDLLEKLAIEHPTTKLIIRPHPSEGRSFYEEKFAKYDNVIVEERFSARSWCLLAKVMLHNGCTTAIESAMLGVPTVCYQPLINEKYDIKLPNQVSICLKTAKEIHEFIENIDEGIQYELTAEQEKVLNSFIANVTINSTDIISSEINKLDIENLKSHLDWTYTLLRMKNYFIKKHGNLITRINKEKGEKLQSFVQYVRHKFSEMKEEEFVQRLNNSLEFLDMDKNEINYQKLPNLESCYLLEKA